VWFGNLNAWICFSWGSITICWWNIIQWNDCYRFSKDFEWDNIRGMNHSQSVLADIDISLGAMRRSGRPAAILGTRLLRVQPLSEWLWVILNAIADILNCVIDGSLQLSWRGVPVVVVLLHQSLSYRFMDERLVAWFYLQITVFENAKPGELPLLVVQRDYPFVMIWDSPVGRFVQQWKIMLLWSQLHFFNCELALIHWTNYLSNLLGRKETLT
jgi:hypothetical protein